MIRKISVPMVNFSGSWSNSWKIGFSQTKESKRGKDFGTSHVFRG